MKARSWFVLLLVLVSLSACSQSRPESQAVPRQPVSHQGLEVATFAGGCFWCTEESAQLLAGVEDVVSGYSGGTTENPTYEQVSTGRTGHAEAVQIWYNPQKITYQDLLRAFFAAHDPTTLNRQGADVGTQYRSVIFYHTPKEKEQAEAYIRELNLSGKYSSPIVTQVVPFKKFWPAEDYHQDYAEHHPDDPYIRSVSKPKLEKVRKEMKGRIKDEK